MTGQLARLLEQATPSDGVYRWQHIEPLHQLQELAPDMARLLIDMAAMLRLPVDDVQEGDCAALLARFAELDARAGGTT